MSCERLCGKVFQIAPTHGLTDSRESENGTCEKFFKSTHGLMASLQRDLVVRVCSTLYVAGSAYVFSWQQVALMHAPNPRVALIAFSCVPPFKARTKGGTLVSIY